MRDNEGLGDLSSLLVRTHVRDKEVWDLIFTTCQDLCEKKGGVGELSSPLVRTGVVDKEEWGSYLHRWSGLV